VLPKPEISQVKCSATEAKLLYTSPEQTERNKSAPKGFNVGLMLLALWTRSVIRCSISKTKFQKLDLLPTAGGMLGKLLLSWFRQGEERSVSG